MNDELNTALSLMITKLVDGVQTGSEFLTAETLEYINQLLMWYGWSEFIYMVLGLILITYTLMTTKSQSIITKQWVDSRTGVGEDFAHLGGLVGTYLSMLIGSCLVNMTWLQIYI